MINLTLKAISLVGVSLVLFSKEPSKAPTAPTPAAPKATPIQVYEKESNQVTFNDSVKIIREMEGSTEVFFVKRGGPFTTPDDGAAMEKLIMSQKSGSAVKIIADDTNQKILRVSAGDSEKSEAKKPSGKSK